MKPHLNRMLGAIVALTLVWGCALTKDRFRPIPLLGQTREQGLQDQQECNEIALVNKGSAVQASSAVGAMSAAAAGAGAGTATAIAVGSALSGAAVRTAAGAAGGAAAGIILAAIFEIERRGIQIYVACMSARGYRVGE